MKKLLIELIGTIVGSAVISIAIAQFLLPNELSSGGFSGIATILYYVLNLPIGITMLVLNIPLLLFSCYKVGKGFFLKTVVGTLSLSFFTELFESLGAVTEDKILACVYGGVLTGIGTAILFKSNSSTGGSDLLSVLIKSFNEKIEMGKAIVIIDFFIILANVILLKNIEIGLYSAITIYLMGVMVDVVFEGIFFSKLIFIISDKHNEISKKIEDEIGRGVTGLYGKGMYTRQG